MNQADAMFTCFMVALFGGLGLVSWAISATSKRLTWAAAVWVAFWMSPPLIGLWVKAVMP